MTPHPAPLMPGAGLDAAVREQDSDLDVMTAYATSDGELRWGPRFHMTSAPSSAEVAVAWEVAELDLLLRRTGGAFVEACDLHPEPLIRVAARGAERLWERQQRDPQRASGIAYVLVEVRHQNQVTAKVRAQRQHRAWFCEARELQQGGYLQQVLTGCPNDLAIAQLLAWLLRRLVLDDAPTSSKCRGNSTPHLLSQWRSTQDLTSQPDLEHESLIHCWGR